MWGNSLSTVAVSTCSLCRPPYILISNLCVIPQFYNINTVPIAIGGVLPLVSVHTEPYTAGTFGQLATNWIAGVGAPIVTGLASGVTNPPW